ncbi:hypothetical protein Tco_0391283, partial [Tanacetum coccineum]
MRQRARIWRLSLSKLYLLLKQLSWTSLEHLSLKIDHLDWLLETMVVEEDLERNQRLQLYQKPLMDQTVVEE